MTTGIYCIDAMDPRQAREALARLYRWMYWDENLPGGPGWNLQKELSGADTIEFICGSVLTVGPGEEGSEDPYAHLSDIQRKHIRKVAIQAVTDDMCSDRDNARFRAERLVDTFGTIDNLLDQLSPFGGDLTEVLGFDPRPGQS